MDSGNMERIMKAQAYKSQADSSQNFYSNQKKTLELNPRHPLIKTLLSKIEADEEDEQAANIAKVMFDTAVLRSGYQLKDQVDFSKRIMTMLYSTLNIDPDTPIEAEPEEEEEEADEDDEEDNDEDSTEAPTKEATEEATEAPKKASEEETHDEDDNDEDSTEAPTKEATE